MERIAEMRNDRIMLDKREYETKSDIYHYITRSDNTMNIVENPYDLIQLDSVKFTGFNGKTYLFTDGLNNYKFYTSKSVVMEEFSAAETDIIERLPIEILSNPFELISQLVHEEKDKVSEEHPQLILPFEKSKPVYEEIFLPLYQDKKEGRQITPISGINIRNSKSKNKGSNAPRPQYEIEVRVPKWVHHIFPKFFGINALDDNELKNSDFDLVVPSGKVLRGRIKQQGGKSLQTNPQGALGEWLLGDVLNKRNYEVITLEDLDVLGVDSLRIRKKANGQFMISLAETNSYEQFKLDNQSLIESNPQIKRKPYFHDEVEDEVEEE